MSRLSLSTPSYQRLQAQIGLSGTFTHALTNRLGVQVQAQVSIEQCSTAIELCIEMGGTRNSITLARSNPGNAARAARHIECVANGRLPSDVPEVDEYMLFDGMEQLLRQAIHLGHGSHHLQADDLTPVLTIMPRREGGLHARIELGDGNSASALLMLTLPADRTRAYAMLADNLSRFLGACRATLTASAA